MKRKVDICDFMVHVQALKTWLENYGHMIKLSLCHMNKVQIMIINNTISE